jgi:hypothetical protein
VGHPGAQVVVVRGDEDLALPGQAAEGAAVVDAVEVPLEAGAEGVRGLGHLAAPGPLGPGGAGGQAVLLDGLPGPPVEQRPGGPDGHGRMGGGDLQHGHAPDPTKGG